MCQHSGGVEVPGFYINNGKNPPKSGTVYRRNGDTRASDWKLSAAEQELKEKEDEAKRLAEVKAAQELWKQGVENTAEVIAYVESRGVRVSDLPGGCLPESIRGTGERFDKVSLVDDKNIWVRTSGPVLLGKAVDAENRLRAVQRIFLRPGGAGKRVAPVKADGSRVDGDEGGGLNVKLAKGPLMGCAVRLMAGCPGGTLHLCEGIETGLAIVAALKEAVWACVSTAGLRNVEFPRAQVGVAIRRWVIWGDHDAVNEKRGHRPGEAEANLAAARLRRVYPKLRGDVVMPTHERCPELVGASGEILK